MNWNKCEIAGHLCRDWELRYTPKGTAISQNSIAVNRTWKDEQGQKREEVDFINVTAFGRTAENLSQYTKKGDPIFVAGRLKFEQWDDKQTGQKRSQLKVIIGEFQFLNRKGGDQGGGSEEHQPQRTSNTRPPVQPDDEPPMPDDDSDVPF